MGTPCGECSGATVWDNDAGSNICTECGTLTDPSQSILSSHIPFADNPCHDTLWEPAGPSTLKSQRHAGKNWNLAGQGKQVAERKGTYAIIEFIKALAVSMNGVGLSPRATTLFQQVKASQPFRWGRRAKLVAGVCFAIALRESNRPDSLADIAFLLGEPRKVLVRLFISTTALLKFDLRTVDPANYISTIQSHLSAALLNHAISPLPKTIMQAVTPLCLRAVNTLATSVSALIPRLCSSAVSQLTTPATACAIYMLALEAESRTTLKNLVDLAQFLGSRFNISKGLVMSRYKIIQDEFSLWIEKMPWLDQYQPLNGRAPLSKRLILARGLKDVVKFQYETLEKRTKPTVDLQKKDGTDVTGWYPSENAEQEPATRPRKRQKPNHITEAMQFLANPLSSRIPSTSTRGRWSLSFASKTRDTQSLPLTTYILASGSLPSMHHPPTRLQLLAIERNGAGSDEIPDDELFDERELDNLLRSPDEVASLRVILGWTSSQSFSDIEYVHPHNCASAKRKRRDLETNIGAGSRLNMTAFTEFMQDEDENRDDNSYLLGLDALATDGKELGLCTADDSDRESLDEGGGREEGVIIPWHSPSPSDKIAFEEYDDEEYD